MLRKFQATDGPPGVRPALLRLLAFALVATGKLLGLLLTLFFGWSVFFPGLGCSLEEECLPPPLWSIAFCALGAVAFLTPYSLLRRSRYGRMVETTVVAYVVASTAHCANRFYNLFFVWHAPWQQIRANLIAYSVNFAIAFGYLWAIGWSYSRKDRRPSGGGRSPSS